MCADTRSRKVSGRARRVHPGTKPFVAPSKRRTNYPLCITRCLNYSRPSGDIRGRLCSFVPVHAAINIDYHGYSFASIGPLICRKFVVPPSVTRRANCLQYSMNSVSRRICAAVSRDMTHHNKCRCNNWTNRMTRCNAAVVAAELIKFKRVLYTVRWRRPVEENARLLFDIILYHIVAGQSNIRIFPSAVLLDIRRTAKYWDNSFMFA